MNKLARHSTTLRALCAVWPPERFIVIGAAALDCRLGLHWRRTFDLDLSVAASIDGCARDLASLGWRHSRDAPQRWLAPDGAIVDVVPAEPTLIAQGGLEWSAAGARMSLTGFRLAFADASLLRATSDCAVRVASLRSLVPLKMSAYLDRPWDRDSDLADLAHVLSAFVGPEADERWSDAVLALDLDFADVSPFLLGRQLGTVTDRTERDLVGLFLRTVLDPGEPLATLHRMARRSPPAFSTVRDLEARWRAFERGFDAASCKS